jgi:hypothetical protein
MRQKVGRTGLASLLLWPPAVPLLKAFQPAKAGCGFFPCPRLRASSRRSQVKKPARLNVWPALWVVQDSNR